MGFSARKRISVGPATLNLSASRRNGAGSSVSFGTKRRKKGALNVTYNSRGRVTVSLYGTGLRYTTSSKGKGKTGKTRAEISEAAQKRRRDAESKRRSREYERKRKADEKERLKIEKAQVREAKRQERVQLKVKDLSSKFLIKLESFISKATLKLDFENKNKSKKKDFTTADIESLWNSRKDIIKGFVKKDIGYKLPANYFSDIKSSDINELLFSALGVDKVVVIDKDIMSLVARESSIRNAVLTVVNDTLYDTYSKKYTRSLHDELLTQFSDLSDSDAISQALQIFGIADTKINPELFDFDDDACDEFYKTKLKRISNDLIYSALDCIASAVSDILSDEVVDDHELDLLTSLLSRFERLYLIVSDYLSIKIKKETNILISDLRQDLFLTACDSIFGEFKNIKLEDLVLDPGELTFALQKYESFRDVLGYRSKIEKLLPIDAEKSLIFSEIYKEVEDSLLQLISSVNDYLEEKIDENKVEPINFREFYSQYNSIFNDIESIKIITESIENSFREDTIHNEIRINENLLKNIKGLKKKQKSQLLMKDIELFDSFKNVSRKRKWVFLSNLMDLYNYNPSLINDPKEKQQFTKETNLFRKKLQTYKDGLVLESSKTSMDLFIDADSECSITQISRIIKNTPLEESHDEIIKKLCLFFANKNGRYEKISKYSSNLRKKNLSNIEVNLLHLLSSKQWKDALSSFLSGNTKIKPDTSYFLGWRISYKVRLSHLVIFFEELIAGNYYKNKHSVNKEASETNFSILQKVSIEDDPKQSVAIDTQIGDKASDISNIESAQSQQLTVKSKIFASKKAINKKDKPSDRGGITRFIRMISEKYIVARWLLKIIKWSLIFFIIILFYAIALIIVDIL